MTPLLYGAAALLGYDYYRKRHKKHAQMHRATVSRVATSRTTRRRNCGTDRRCACRSH